ncbi:MAG: response regulator [Methanosarcinaceae archaeon]|nr:response regulator [Methanosarcinaceae archaeon]
MTKILVADDDTVMLGLLKTLLEMEEFEVTSVIRQDEILPAVEKEKPAMILMDFHLAGGNALNAIKNLKSNQIYQDLPVLVTSGMDCKDECMAAGANGFILKPFRPSTLIEIIRAFLKEGRQA